MSKCTKKGTKKATKITKKALILNKPTKQHNDTKLLLNKNLKILRTC